MFTDCPTCARTYQISRAALGESGRTVVCPSCQTRWYVAGPETEGVGVPLPALDRARPAMPAPRPSARGRSARLLPVAVGLSCLALASGLIGARASLVRAVPRAAGLYAALGMPVNVRGLVLGDVKAAWPSDGATRVAISGRIRNVAAAGTPVPRLTFDLRDAKGAVLASWSSAAPKRMLARGEVVAFATETSVLPEGARDVVVRFTDAGAERPLLAAR